MKGNRVSVRNRWYRSALALGIVAIAGVALVGMNGCGYDPSRGNPVDQFHYDHVIFVRNDYSQVSIQTYINRTQWQVGLERKDLYDGDRDGALTTAGLDRVAITTYQRVEDPPEQADIMQGDIANYDSIFKEILGAAKAGKKDYKMDGRTYEFRFISQEIPSGLQQTLG